jgi:penicillin V acylase-like amidase (Ntn superfamily)
MMVDGINEKGLTANRKSITTVNTRHFESTINPIVIWVYLDKMTFNKVSPVLKLDLSPSISGLHRTSPPNIPFIAGGMP